MHHHNTTLQAPRQPSISSIAYTQDKKPTYSLPALLSYLHRGGRYAYYWTEPGRGSHWKRAGKLGTQIPAGDAVYFGVHPTERLPERWKDGKRQHPGGIRATIADVAVINCVFAEFDAKDFGESKPATLAHIEALAIAPSVIVDSGGGYHCYWLLPAPFVFANQSDRERAKRLQAAWVSYVHGDKNAKDLARVLRVPGTLNHKYDPARPVFILRADYSRTYNLADLETLARPTTPTPPNTTRKTNTNTTTDGGKWLTEALERATVGNRNSTGFWLACQLRDDGLSQAAAESLLSEYAARVPGEDYSENEALASLRQAYSQPAREPARNVTGGNTSSHAPTPTDGGGAMPQPAPRPRLVPRWQGTITRADYAACPGDAKKHVHKCGERAQLPLKTGRGVYLAITFCNNPACPCTEKRAAYRALRDALAWAHIFARRIGADDWARLRDRLKAQGIVKIRIPQAGGELVVLTPEPIEGASEITLDDLWDVWQDKPAMINGRRARVSADHAAPETTTDAAGIVAWPELDPEHVAQYQGRDRLKHISELNASEAYEPSELAALKRGFVVRGIGEAGEEVLRATWLEYGFVVNGWQAEWPTIEHARAWIRDRETIVKRIKAADSGITYKKPVNTLYAIEDSSCIAGLGAPYDGQLETPEEAEAAYLRRQQRRKAA